MVAYAPKPLEEARHILLFLLHNSNSVLSRLHLSHPAGTIVDLSRRRRPSTIARPDDAIRIRTVRLSRQHSPSATATSVQRVTAPDPGSPPF